MFLFVESSAKRPSNIGGYPEDTNIIHFEEHNGKYRYALISIKYHDTLVLCWPKGKSNIQHIERIRCDTVTVAYWQCMCRH